MDPIVILLIVLLILALGGWRFGGDQGPYLGGGLGLVLIVLLVLYLMGALHR